MRFRVFKVENATDYILTALLLVCALSIAINRHQDGINNLRQFSITIVSLLEEPLSNIRVYRQALNTNTYLQRQNILLQDELSRLRAIEQENRELRNLLEFKEESEYGLKPVTFVSKELTGLNNSFTIDAGFREDITKGMPVITSDGLIGKVVLTSGYYSQVMPYYNNLFRVSARVSETRSTGIVSWSGENMSELVMDFVPKTVPIDSGFVIETSGFGNEFPAGIPIGKVIRTEEEPGKDTQRIFLQPFASLFNVAEGFVIIFEPDSSIENLEQGYNELFR
ncbi:MAG: rod shape-determining protein MreC [Balneolaceae bacterium]|nr:rod shape-determining protein MreC [Balneolaceae bacterium]MBO6547631.1 rod shape-determining protein MreC [Balneolaceae bacterium]MBO6648142.1 rod shape-determining protein MreC [Balneolaceae bacterium]